MLGWTTLREYHPSSLDHPAQQRARRATDIHTAVIIHSPSYVLLSFSLSPLRSLTCRGATTTCAPSPMHTPEFFFSSPSYSLMTVYGGNSWRTGNETPRNSWVIHGTQIFMPPRTNEMYIIYAHVKRTFAALPGRCIVRGFYTKKILERLSYIRHDLSIFRVTHKTHIPICFANKLRNNRYTYTG